MAYLSVSIRLICFWLPVNNANFSVKYVRLPVRCKASWLCYPLRTALPSPVPPPGRSDCNAPECGIRLNPNFLILYTSRASPFFHLCRFLYTGTVIAAGNAPGTGADPTVLSRYCSDLMPCLAGSFGKLLCKHMRRTLPVRMPSSITIFILSFILFHDYTPSNFFTSAYVIS